MFASVFMIGGYSFQIRCIYQPMPVLLLLSSHVWESLHSHLLGVLSAFLTKAGSVIPSAPSRMTRQC